MNAVTGYFLVTGAAIELTFLAPDAATWLKYVAVGVLVSPFVAIAGLVGYVTVLGFIERARDRRAFQVSGADGIDVFASFLNDREDHIQVLDDEAGRSYAGKYDIVRRIHGDDNASRLTHEQVESEYDRYDRAEAAAAEERCQTCDPVRVPATFLVQAWDDRWYVGEWVLCNPHAEAKVTGIRRTGVQAIAEPLGGDAQ